MSAEKSSHQHSKDAIAGRNRRFFGVIPAGDALA